MLDPERYAGSGLDPFSGEPVTLYDAFTGVGRALMCASAMEDPDLNDELAPLLPFGELTSYDAFVGFPRARMCASAMGDFER